MSVKTGEMTQLADATYAHTLVIESETFAHRLDIFTRQTLSIHWILNFLTCLVFSDITLEKSKTK